MALNPLRLARSELRVLDSESRPEDHADARKGLKELLEERRVKEEEQSAVIRAFKESSRSASTVIGVSWYKPNPSSEWRCTAAIALQSTSSSAVTIDFMIVSTKDPARHAMQMLHRLTAVLISQFKADESFPVVFSVIGANLRADPKAVGMRPIETPRATALSSSSSLAKFKLEIHPKEALAVGNGPWCYGGRHHRSSRSSHIHRHVRGVGEVGEWERIVPPSLPDPDRERKFVHPSDRREFVRAFVAVKVIPESINKRFRSKFDSAGSVFVSVHPTSTVVPVWGMPAWVDAVGTKEEALCGMIVASKCPRGVILHFELATRELDVKGLRNVFTHLAMGSRVEASGEYLYLDRLAEARPRSAVVPLKVVDTDGEGQVVCSLLVELRSVYTFDSVRDKNKGRDDFLPVFTKERVKRMKDEERAAVFVRWNESISQMQRSYETSAKFPNGDAFHISDLPTTVDSCLGPMPLLFYFVNASRINVASDREQADLVSAAMLHMLAVRMGWNTDERDRALKDESLAVEITAQMIRQIPSLVAYAPDSNGDAWTTPLSEQDLLHSSQDCEDLSALHAVCAAYIRASTQPILEPMRKVLARYTGMYFILTSRVGKPDKVEGSGPTLHCQYWLLPTAYVEHLQTPEAKRSQTPPSYEPNYGHAVMLEPLFHTEPVAHSRLSRGLPDEILFMPVSLDKLHTRRDLFDRRYLKSIVAAFISDGSNPRQIHPLTAHRSGKPTHGVDAEFLLGMSREAHRDISFAVSQSPTKPQLDASMDIFNETQHVNNLYVSPDRFQLKAELLDILALQSSGSVKVVFEPCSDAWDAKRMEKRLLEDCRRAEQKAKEKHPSEYKGLYAKLLTAHDKNSVSKLYIADGLTAYVAAVFRPTYSGRRDPSSS